jgi:hypothetical protein
MTFDAEKHLIKLKGKDYLEAKWRLVWLRTVHPDAVIETQHIDIDMDRGHAVFRATVTLPSGGSATGYGSESAKDFPDFIEKAETKGLARALAALGFGTQFTGDELSEGERIVDSPVDRQPRQAQPQRQQAPRDELGGPPMTDKQRGLIISLAKDLGMVSDDGHHDAAALDAELRQFCGMTMETLTVGAASKVIEEFKARPKGASEPEPIMHDRVDEARAQREADWLAAIDGAGSYDELQKVGTQIAAAGARTEALSAAWAKKAATFRRRA